MSEQENFVFNGETIVLTFKIKDNAADGNYAVNICKETDLQIIPQKVVLQLT